MKEKSFVDLVNEDMSNLPDGKKGFVEIVNRTSKPKDKSFFNDVKDYAKTFLKGTAEGLGRLGRMMGPTYDYPKFENGKFTPPKSSEQQLEAQTEALDELLPTDEGFGQSALRRGLRMGPTMTAFPGSNPVGGLVRSGVAGLSGEAVKELGGGEIAQTAAELTAFAGPDVMKRLLAKGKNAEIISYAKSMGMTDSQITPLIQSPFKQRWLSKISSKGKSTQDILGKTKSGIDKIATSIESSPNAAKEISEVQNGKLINGLYNTLENLPRSLRSNIEGDLGDLLNNKITGKSLINFWRDINSRYGLNKNQIQLMKKPINEALESVSPSLKANFEMSNKLYSKYFPIASKLKPGLADKIIRASKVVGGVGAGIGALFGRFEPIAGLLGHEVLSQVSKEMLTNPRFQQIGRKSVQAINENRFGMVKKLIDLYAHEIKQKSPELSKQMNNLTEEEIEEFFKSSHNK